MKYYFIFYVILLLSCNQNKKEKLVIYSPHGKEMLAEFEKLYEEKNPNVDIQWLDMGSQEILDRVSTEANNPQADIWWGAPSTMFMKAEKLGLLQKYKPSWAENIPIEAKSKNEYWYGTFSTPEVIAFNDKNKLDTNIPKDWNSLINPTFKNKIILRNPMASGTLRAIFCGIIQQSIAKTGNEKAGWDWLKQLNANTQNYTADATQMYTKLSSENNMVTLWNMPDMVLQKNKYNYPFDYTFPTSGTVVLTDAIAILKNTKHESLAKSYYEFVTSKESLQIEAEKYYRIPTRTDMDKNKLPNWLKNINYKSLDIDWQIVSDNEAVWMKKWDEEIKSKN